jgi:hypothetical protein
MQDLLEIFDQFIANRRKEHKDPRKGKFCDDQFLVLVCRAALRSVEIYVLGKAQGVRGGYPK